MIHLEFGLPTTIFRNVSYFIYVGTEVTIISNLPALLHTVEFGRILEDAVPPFIVVLGKFDDWPMEWWCKCFKTSTLVNTALKFIVPAVAFGVIIGANIFC
jgi:FHS family L-fucose permease-like MFS transporter